MAAPTGADRSFTEFGPLGSIFSLLPWLITKPLVAVVGLTVGQVVASSAWYARLTGQPSPPQSPA